MSKLPPKKRLNRNSVIGSWVNGDEYETNVEYIVAQIGDHFTVRAVDRFDGEEGNIYDIKYDAEALAISFNVQWKSTGRFMNVRLRAISPNRVSYTYTYTENQMWFRKGTEPGGGAEARRRRRR